MDICTLAALVPRLLCLEQRESWTSEQILAHQAQTLSKLRRYVYTLSPFYQAFHHGLENAPLEALPVLTKQTLMENFDSLVTEPAIRLDAVREHIKTLKGDGRYLNRYWVNATSGTSGEPGIFLYNRAEWATVIASSARGLKWGGLDLKLWRRHKMAVIASMTPQHMSLRLTVTSQTPWSKNLSLAASEPIEKLVGELNRYQPEFLVTYAFTAKLLAEEQAAGRLKIKPKAIFTSAEVLSAENRKKVESVWGRILFNQYAATETGGIAAECPQHEGLHLFDDLFILELVDDKNRPIPVGSYGEKLLVTVLFKKVQPLIRYEITDSLRLREESCSMQHPFRLIDEIQGRLQDILYFPSTKGGEVAIHPSVFHEVMDMLPAGAWQVVQTETGIKVLLQGLANGFSEAAVKEKLESALSSQSVCKQQIQIEPVALIPKGANNKTILIKALPKNR